MSSVSTSGPCKVRILHFNDVYNVEPRTTEPCGGASRFKTAILSLVDSNTMVLFSGDCVAPSIMSTFTKGEQMIPVLNECRVDCAVLGNHDFDFGVDNLEAFIKRTTFPWLMSNVTDVETGKPLGGAQITHIIEKAGKKFGLIGLVEEEWLATLSTIDREDVIYVDYVSEGQKLAKYLKEEEKVDYVIALTHMRFPNDSRLAANVNDIDIILGGHDHVFDIRSVNDKLIVKSGTDFRQFSNIELTFYEDGNLPVGIDIKEVEIRSSNFTEDATLKAQIEKFSDIIEGKMDMILGHFYCDLDGRFSSIRNQETNLGNFFADIMLSSTLSDVAILNSGTLRSDQIHPKGDFKLKDLVHIMPIMDPMIVLSASGEVIWKALENGVSQWPKLEGRFPQVSGIRFAFDPTKPPGHRIDPNYIKIGDEYIDLKKHYRLCTKAYLYQGKDGYNCLKECEVLVPEEECPELCTAIQNHFASMSAVTTRLRRPSRHLQKFVAASKSHTTVSFKMSLDAPTVPLNNNNGISNNKDISNNTNGSTDNNNGLMIENQTPFGSPSPDHNHRDMGLCRLEPKVEDRIIILTNEVR